MKNNPIGVFDSGVGGLSCVPAIIKELPCEQIIYFGDTGRAPYGSRPDSEIIELSLDVAERLINMDCKSLSIACNTISCVAIDAIKKAFPSVPVLGIVEPAAEFVAKNYAGRRVGLIATEATVRSMAYPKAISRFGGTSELVSKATPEFVPLIEAGKAGTDEMRSCIKANLDGFADDIDALILGCTHYPFIKEQIATLYPWLAIIDPAQQLAVKTREMLAKNGILASERQRNHKFISSSGNEFFESVVRNIKEKNSLF